MDNLVEFLCCFVYKVVVEFKDDNNNLFDYLVLFNFMGSGDCFLY